MIFFNKNNLERFRQLLTQKIDFESQIFSSFDKFYSTDHKTKKLLNGLVVGFGPKGKPERMCALKFRSY